MTLLIVILALVLLMVVILQIGKVTEMTRQIRGEEESELRETGRQALMLLIFGVVFLILTIVSALYFKNYMLGFGPHEAASEHGLELDSMFKMTLFFTGIVFFLTQAALFWFTYKYRKRSGTKSVFLAHNNTLEIVWTAVPAVVMTILVFKGLVAWNNVMPDVSPEDEYIEIGATAWQFAWNLRYPGPDGKLGEKDFTLIKPGVNELGQDWTDPRNHDDFMSDELVLPVGKKVRIRISARDVLHNFYLPHFRLKMDAVPGIPTYFIFTPTKTTEEYRKELSKYPEYQGPSDPDDPASPPKWQAFNYELACAELCGTGHYSMKRPVRVVTEAEYDEWFKNQKSWYQSQIQGTENDPLWEGSHDGDMGGMEGTHK